MREDNSPVVQGDASSDPLSDAVSRRDRDVVQMVADAVDGGNAMLAFQPVVAAGRNVRPAFYEGLIRVLDRTGRIIPARDFILQIENKELGRRIDAISLRLGLEALRRHPGLRLSVNLSALSIGYPLWTQTLNAGIEADPTVAERLILEITESSAITAPRLVSDFICALQDRGVAFALDDFGSGYTSMRYLKDFCFDILKMDGEFCNGVARNPDNMALVKAMISIGAHFDMLTVAESVENQQDASALIGLGVDCLQGYLYGAPTIRPRWEPCRNVANG
ncbi:EAL domain-containing protein [Palleronia sp. THAF1]|uniref:EAL domain-containing protein n=1 Tax=Palleronia sp. THAF1 TaxID=2587842 RepID=UPI000F51BE17|nr:EAL domain-containing protein [Palleronia sp. THAF1]